MSIPQPRAPRRDAAENREAIIVAAAAALNDDIDASLETIAARAGLTRRSIYGHFATRDDLLVETFTRGAARIGASLLPVSDPDARVEIALYGATLWAEVEHVRVAAQLAVRGPHRARVAEALEPARQKLLETVERGIADGTLRDDIDAPTLSRLIEAAAVAVLDEATRTGMTDAEGRRLVMLNGLGAAGIGWREADLLLSETEVLQ
jgi:AcrR family transcriptional regulator